MKLIKIEGDILENVTLTNMCMIINKPEKKVVVQNRIKNWKGIAFPGGHIEKGESIVKSVIREVKEETGLDICNLELCGVKDWYNEDNNSRYIVFLYKTNTYKGKLLRETLEGEVFWLDIDELPNQNLAHGFNKMLEVFFSSNKSEFYHYNNDKNNEVIDSVL